MGQPASATRWAGQRSSFVVGALLAAVAAVAWVEVLRQAPSSSGDMSMPSMPGLGPSTSVGDAAAFVGSWAVMMAAMMLPSATPMIALYATVSRQREKYGWLVGVFVAPYLLVWVAAGLPAYAGTRLVVAGMRHSAELTDRVPYAVAAVLIGAGMYQFSAAKRVCLRQCQAPLLFLTRRWRAGPSGAARVGLAHAGYCLGCCWALMVVLVAAGTMGLPWVLLIAILVLIEKLIPYKIWPTRAAGVFLTAFGLAIAIHPALAATIRG